MAATLAVAIANDNHKQDPNLLATGEENRMDSKYLLNLTTKGNVQSQPQAPFGNK